MSREFLLRGFNDSVVQAYYDYMVDMAVIFGADKDTAKEELLDVLWFEMNLANVSSKKKKFNFIIDLTHANIFYFIL